MSSWIHKIDQWIQKKSAFSNDFPEFLGKISSSKSAKNPPKVLYVDQIGKRFVYPIRQQPNVQKLKALIGDCIQLHVFKIWPENLKQNLPIYSCHLAGELRLSSILGGPSTQLTLLTMPFYAKEIPIYCLIKRKGTWQQLISAFLIVRLYFQ